MQPRRLLLVLGCARHRQSAHCTNTLCIAYGGNRAAFQDFVNSKWLPPERAKNCEAEYRQAYNAFAKTIYPFIDQAKMEKVMKRAWFQPKETKEK